MVRAIVSESNGLGWSSGWGHCVVFLGRTLLTVPHSTQVCKWIPLNLMLPGVTLRWINIPSRAKCKYPQSLNDRNQDNLDLDGPLASFADLTYLQAYLRSSYCNLAQRSLSPLNSNLFG